MTDLSASRDAGVEADDDTGMTLGDIIALLRPRWKLLTLAPLAAGLIALGVTYLIPPTFTAATTFLPPQQAQSSAASALASLGALSGLAVGAVGVKSPAEQFVALMQSVTVSDRIIDQFKLMDLYDAKYRVDARKELAQNVHITVGRKDGLITVEVDDHSPQRAADMANHYVAELRRLTGTLAVSEAQQRRVFFEQQLQQTRERLVQAQQALQASGFAEGALKVDPKAAGEQYARLRAEAIAADVNLQRLRRSLADSAPEVQQQQTLLSALREQLAQARQPAEVRGSPDYVSKYREFKYEETLFEIYARQYESARADEAREGALIQVVDVALPPERKSKPKRALIAAATILVVLVLLSGFVLVRQVWLRTDAENGEAANRH